MKLGPELLSARQGGGGAKMTYIEGWRVINLANEVFGFDGWTSEVKSLEIDFLDFDPETSRWSMGVTAIVKVTLKDGCSREDVGYGKAENIKSKADSLDKCKKEAVTDALKRALRTFGNLLGNCLYDKTFVSEVGKMKAPKPKFDCDELYRPSQFPKAPPTRPGTPATMSAPATSPRKQIEAPPAQNKPPQNTHSNGPPRPSVPMPRAPPQQLPPVPRPSINQPPAQQQPKPPTAIPGHLKNASVRPTSNLSTSKVVSAEEKPQVQPDLFDPMDMGDVDEAAFFGDMSQDIKDVNAQPGQTTASGEAAPQPAPLHDGKPPVAAQARQSSSGNGPTANQTTKPAAQNQPSHGHNNAQPARVYPPIVPVKLNRPPPNTAAARPMTIDQSKSGPITKAQLQNNCTPVRNNAGGPSFAAKTTDDVAAFAAKAVPEIGAMGGFGSARGVKRDAVDDYKSPIMSPTDASNARTALTDVDANKRQRLTG